ncbi:MAG: CapA family protein [Acidimicrobiales bacterium]
MVVLRRILVSVGLVIAVLAVGLAVEASNRPAGVPDEPMASAVNRPVETATVLAAVETKKSEPLARELPPRPPAPRLKIKPPAQVTMAFTGDIIPHGRVVRQAQADSGESGGYNFVPMFTQVRDVIASADLAICHLETPLSADNTRISGYPQFNAPRELANALAEVGYDGCSVASNHSYDRRETGVDQTLDVLDSVGVGTAGMARSATEANSVRLYKVGAVSVAHLSFTYGLNGFVLPEGKEYLVNVIDADVIEARAVAARAAGADIVVLSMHWGNEYASNPSPFQTELADRLLVHPDIDLIIGHHAHVVQPVEERDGEFVVFGLGNFLSNQSGECCVRASQDGVIVQVTFTEQRTGGFEASSGCIIPTWVDRSDYVILVDGHPDRPLPAESATRTRDVIGSSEVFGTTFTPQCAPTVSK